MMDDEDGDADNDNADDGDADDGDADDDNEEVARITVMSRGLFMGGLYSKKYRSLLHQLEMIEYSKGRQRGR